MRLAVSREERYWYPDDGGVVWVAGFMPVDRTTGRFLSRDALREQGLVVSGVAGAQFNDDVLQSDAAEPGAPLVLRRDPANEHDPNAIAVEAGGGDASVGLGGAGKGGPQLGWVPREVAAEIAPRLDAGEEWSAIVLREQRDSPRDPRKSVTMGLARAARIELFEPFA